MNIWIDLANSPHVLFFAPIIQKLKDDGHNVLITMRDFAQTIPLAHKFHLEGEIIGKHGGTNRGAKVSNLIKRTTQLVTYARRKSIDIAVSHNSYTHTIAGRLIGAKVITIMDYEGQPANHLAFRFAHKVIVPEGFPDNALKRFGARTTKTYKYKGFKEQLYLSNFKPNNDFIQELSSATNLTTETLQQKIIVAVRTPPTMALYHHFQNVIFDNLLNLLNNNDSIAAIVFPRTDQQKEHIIQKFKNLHVPTKPLDGMDLCFYSDLVISAGGTMNREAAILGTPAYSTFSGSMPAVDEQLIKMGRMIHINHQTDFATIPFVKKTGHNVLENQGLLEEIIKETITT
jgi:predicted glycosyltransferase